MSFFHICLDAVGNVLLEVVEEEAVVVEVIALRTEAGHGRIDVEHVNGLQAVGGSGVEHAVLHHRGRNVEPVLGLAVVNYGVVLLDADDVLRGLRNLADARGFAACLLLLLHEPNVIVISIIDATTINRCFCFIFIYIFSSVAKVIKKTSPPNDEPVKLEEHHRQEVCDDGRSGDADEARHHERVVEQVFADDGGAGAVEVDGGDIRRIVGDEEISVNRRKYA